LKINYFAHLLPSLNVTLICCNIKPALAGSIMAALKESGFSVSSLHGKEKVYCIMSRHEQHVHLMSIITI
jgi:hypothetical protein